MSVCVWVCYHNNSKLHASILTHQTGFVGKGSDHLQLIKFWPSHAPGKGVCGGAIFLALPYYSQYAMFASPPNAFSFLLWLLVNMLYINIGSGIETGGQAEQQNSDRNDAERQPQDSSVHGFVQLNTFLCVITVSRQTSRWWLMWC